MKADVRPYVSIDSCSNYIVDYKIMNEQVKPFAAVEEYNGGLTLIADCRY